MDDEIGVPLKAFCEGRKQSQVACLLGVTQGSISQMINSNRDIRVKALPGGEFRAVELVSVGRKRAA